MKIEIPRGVIPIKGFCSDEVVRYALTGVHVQTRKGRLLIEASDGKRVCQVDLPQGENPEMDVIVPIELWGKVPRPGKGIDLTFNLEVTGDRNEVPKVTLSWLHKDVSYSVATRAVEGKFPDTGDILSENDIGHGKAKYNLDLLAGALDSIDKMVRQLSGKSYSGATLSGYGSSVANGAKIHRKTDEFEITAVVMGLTNLT